MAAARESAPYDTAPGGSSRALVRARPFLLAAAGGVLGFLGFAGFGIWPLSLICLIPLWQAIEGSPLSQAQPGDSLLPRLSLRTAALLGFTFGFVGYLGGFHWMWRIVDVFLGGNAFLGAALFLADCSWFALRFALYGAAYALVRRNRWPIAVAALPTLIAVEWLYPTLFPVYLGESLAERVTLIQICDLGGPLLLTAFLVLVNLAGFETWRWRRKERSRPVSVWAATAIAVAFVWTYGTVRVRQIDAAIAAAPALKVGIVQGNLGVFEKGRQPGFDHRKYLEQTRELVAEGEPDLVIWPETVYTRGLLRPLPLSGRMIREDLNVPLLFGSATVSGETGKRLKYNSALLVGADGAIRDAYDKNLLIPFTEYVPFADVASSIFGGLADASEFTASDQTPGLTLGEWRMSTPICYEAVRPAFVRRMVLTARPHLIVELANDSWFGDSQEPWLHLTLAKFRAVEHRRYMIRATNSGISTVVDAAGREVARSGLLTRENLRATVHRLEGASLYTEWGDWPGWIALFVAGGAMATRRRR